MRPAPISTLWLCAWAAACTGTVTAEGRGADDDPAAVDAGAPGGGAPVYERGLSAVFFDRYFGVGKEDVVAAADFQWGEDAPAEGLAADFWALRLEGEVRAPRAGTYAFRADVDDGLRVWVGDRLVIDNWLDGTFSLDWVDVELEKGWHPIRVEYYELFGPAHLQLRWRRPSGAEEILSGAFLRTAGTPELASPQPNYVNPVTPFGCADPGALKVGDWIYVACTGGRMRIRRSRDLVLWEDTEVYVMPPGGKPPWSASGSRNWAPELHRVGDKFIAYFTANDGQGRLSVGAAVADSMAGPFVHQPGPMVTHADGVIDATFFEDTDGRRYLIYKIDGNAFGRPTPNYIRELRPDGLGFADGSSQVEILRNNVAWEGPVTEAAWLHKRGDTYYLFYSGNVYDSRYRTGVARSSSVTGPFEKLGPPILSNNGTWVGPGHGSIVQMGGLDYWVYHAWPTTPGGAQDSSRGRLMMVDRIDWEGGWPRIEGDGTPSTTHRPRPGSRELCHVEGAVGECVATDSCDGTPVPGLCTGPTSVQCCIP